MALTQVTTGMIADASVTPAKFSNAGAELGMRNRIINGAMQLWQRGTSGFTTNLNYAADRWLIGTSTSLSAVAQSTDVPSGYKYSLSIAGTNYPNAVQRIESVNCIDLAGQNVTFSFWLKQSSGAGTNSIGVALYYANSSDNFGAVTQIGTTTTITATSSWAQYTVTFPAISSNAVNGIQIQIFANTASTATFLITGAQLEMGATATPFERRPYSMELSLCQRYYQQFSAYSSAANTPAFLRTTMRAAPTVTAASGTVSFAGVTPSADAFWHGATSGIQTTFYANAEL